MASLLDKKPRTALNIAEAVVNDIIAAQEFIETYAKKYRIQIRSLGYRSEICIRDR